MNTLATQKQEARLVFRAPLSGIVVPLEEVPDPVFSQKMAGEGLAIEPTSEIVVAPFDGEVVQIHPAHHAMTIRHASGVEVLIHVGLDTVTLKGSGFEMFVKQGDKVRAGDQLLRMDADFIAGQVPSLMSPIILVGEQNWDFEVEYGPVKAGASGFLTVRLPKHQSLAAEAVSSTDGDALASHDFISDPLQISLAEGLHARPASLIVQTSKRFDAVTHLIYKEDKADCRSLVQILKLAVPSGGQVHFCASGPDAEKACRELVRLISTMKSDAHAPAKEASIGNNTNAIVLGESQLGGISAAPGVAAGYVFVNRREVLNPIEEGTSIAREKFLLLDSMEKVRLELEEIEHDMKGRIGAGQAAIFAAHQDIIEDPEILDAVGDLIQSGKSAAWALNTILQVEADRLATSSNELIAARANDLLDVRRRWVSQLMGEEIHLAEIPANSILIADDLTPSETATLDRRRVLGFCTRKGGTTSHVAILARSLDLPALAAIDPRALQLANGTPVILDADSGYLELNPTPEKLARIEKLQAQMQVQRQEQEKKAQLPATTTDNKSISVLANFSSDEEAEHGARLGAEGVGLMRSEFLFLNRSKAPTEEEQFQIYSLMARQMGPNLPIVIRALDIGGDKPLAYCHLPKEENPFLGERGIRMLLKEDTLFRTQVRAILRASEFGTLKIMLPMVTNVDEVLAAKKLISDEAQALGRPMISVGIMIEVPAAVLIADQLAPEVDFFSIGTNDLTQYVLAMDRNHQALAKQVDALHPAVLKMIDLTAAAAHRANIEISVCGGLAGDQLGIPVLIGLGVDKLSVSLPSVPAVKAQVRELNYQACVKLAKSALQGRDASAVRELIRNWNPEGTQKGN